LAARDREHCFDDLGTIARRFAYKLRDICGGFRPAGRPAGFPLAPGFQRVSSPATGPTVLGDTERQAGALDHLGNRHAHRRGELTRV
jgi:hypothetical protein